MVIAVAVLDLLVGEILYELTDGACCAEVKRSALDSGDFACSHIGGVYRSVSVGNNLHEIVGDGVSRIAGEVEVGMVCKVYDSGFIGSRCIFNIESIVTAKCVSHGCGQVAREFVVAAGRYNCEGESGVVESALPDIRDTANRDRPSHRRRGGSDRNCS